jgi:hypothetical protein
MKRHLLFAILAFTGTALYAQTDLNTAADAVRYTDGNMNGTARYRAMSGAFGALGGDLSAMMINPASSAVFNFNSGTISLTSYNIANRSSYFGTETKTHDNSFELNQVGAVFVFKNMKDDAFMNKFSVAFNYENTDNFDNRIFSAGINPTNSIDQYFLGYANGIPLSTLENSYYEDLSFNQQQAYLGYNAYIINPRANTPNNTSYVSNVPQNSNYYQENSTSATGYNGKIALNFGAQLKKRFYVGANLNIHFTDYLKGYSVYEDYNTSPREGLQAVRFDNERYTYGGGFSFNLGAIVKVTESFRLGLAYESPTWMNLQDEIRQRIVSDCPDCDDNEGAIITDPGMTFILNDYTIQSPSTYTGSLAYVFAQNGLISIDYSFKDYGNTKYTSSRYSTINTELKNTLDLAGELRIGAEYRIKNISLRGGYRYEQSPYKNKSTLGDLNGFSGGLGFAFGNQKIDLAYSYFSRKMDMPILPMGFSDTARINSRNNNVTLSYTIDL